MGDGRIFNREGFCKVKTFSDLGIIPTILSALEEEGYENPSPIQEQAIPPALAGRDLLGCAQTGTGKTAAFAVPILQRLSARPAPAGGRPIRALILTPTRELALQIHESFEAYGRHLKLRGAVIFGGVSQVPQVAALKKGVDILTATPGRLNDLIGQGHIDLSRVEIFVLDEADRMLDMGFVHDVKKVIAKVPQKKQTLFFSATMPPEIVRLVDSLLVDPVKVAVAPVSSTVDAIEQSVYFVDKENKRRLLVDLLQNPAIESALVFTRTKHGADRVVKDLTRAGVRAMAIHGNKSQNARQAALSSFKSGELRVLVATDIAARGIDINELSHVINYDLPNVPETYVHRIGRTGRAGLAGTAISFCDFDEQPYLKDIQKLIRKEVPVVEGHPYPMTATAPTEKPAPPSRSRREGGASPRADGQGASRGETRPAAGKSPAGGAASSASDGRSTAGEARSGGHTGRAPRKPPRSQEASSEPRNRPKKAAQSNTREEGRAGEAERFGASRALSGGAEKRKAESPQSGEAIPRPEPNVGNRPEPARPVKRWQSQDDGRPGRVVAFAVPEEWKSGAKTQEKGSGGGQKRRPNRRP